VIEVIYRDQVKLALQAQCCIICRPP